MIRILSIVSLFFFVSIAVTSCKFRPRELETYKEYKTWMVDPENGLSKTKYVNGLKLTVKYLPTDYLVYQDLQGNSDINIVDSLRSRYSQSHTFLLNIAPDARDKDMPQGASVMTRDIKDMEDYKLRSLIMNFDMQHYVSIKNGDLEFVPVLAEMENTYDLTKDRTIYLVFSDKANGDLLKGETLDFIFEDEIFATGLNHFKFDAEDIREVPALKF